MKFPAMNVHARVWTVRADASITDCVRILRDRSVGALIVLSADRKEEIVGIFTERDLVKNFELIHTGGFWETAVRTVMTSNVHTIPVSQISDAPRIMARHQIRHLPIVADEKGKTKLVGVISMRDLFRFAMEEFNYDLDEIYRRPKPAKTEKPKNKMMGIFSSDPAISQLVEKGAKLTKHLLVQATSLRADFGNLHEVLNRFDSLFIDLDGLSPVEVAKVLAAARTEHKEGFLILAFSPAKMDSRVLEELRRVSGGKRIKLLSKPVALGVLYEQFLRGP